MTGKLVPSPLVCSNLISILQFTAGGPLRIEIMDLSGNRPVIRIRQNAGGQPAFYYRHPDKGFYMLRRGGKDVLRIDLTGIVTNADMYYVFSDREQCVYPGHTDP